jgi:hypothetical protein
MAFTTAKRAGRTWPHPGMNSRTNPPGKVSPSRYNPNTDPHHPDSVAWRRDVHLPRWASRDDAPMVIYNEHFADNVAHNPQSSKALYDNCRRAGMDVALYMREIVNNLDQSPNLFDWMIERLKK